MNRRTEVRSTHRVMGGLLLVALFPGFPSESWAQAGPGSAPERGARYSLNGGVGVGTEGLGLQIGASRHHPKGDLIVRLAGTTNVDIFGPSTSYSDLAILYGRMEREPGAWGRIAAGPAVVWGNSEGRCMESGTFFCSKRDQDRETSIGLAVLLDAVWTPFSFAGVGLGVFGNLNSLGAFAGATLSLHIGQVR